MVVMESGRVVVPDLEHRTYHLFNADGSFERMVRMVGDPGFTVSGIHLAQRGAEAVITTPLGERFATSLSNPDGRIPQLEDPVSRSIERLRLTGDEVVTDSLVGRVLLNAGAAEDEECCGGRDQNCLHVPGPADAARLGDLQGETFRHLQRYGCHSGSSFPRCREKHGSACANPSGWMIRWTSPPAPSSCH